MKKVTICLICAFLLTVTGCSRPVQVVDEKAFIDMARRMPEEMQSRSLLTHSKAYTEALTPAPSEAYGKILYNRLDIDFLSDIDKQLPGRTFKEISRPSDRLQINDTNFSLEMRNLKIKAKMVGILDWDGNGIDSWLISCLAEPKNGHSREYYLLIPTPLPQRGLLKSNVAAVYDCFGMACTMYVHDGIAKTKMSSSKDSSQTIVRESLPGLNQITLPPSEVKEDSPDISERAL